MKFKLLLMCLVACSFQGCATYHNPASSPEVSAQIKVERDDYRKVTRWWAPSLVVWHDGTGPNAGNSSVILRAARFDATADVTYQIYITDIYSGDWRFYDSIYDADGNRLETLKIASNVVSCRSGCTLQEDVAANVSKKYLLEHMDRGVSLQVSSPSSKFVVNIPAFYVRGFLEKNGF